VQEWIYIYTHTHKRTDSVQNYHVITFTNDGNFTGGSATNVELNDIRTIKEWMFKISL
jgi:hypothetical protein